MSIEVGRELGLDAVHLKRVELGALFHDIGKIGIPASILMKPGPLTTEERSMIERHLELGERILAPIDQLAQVRPIVRACHERYDGLGYPDSLKGEEIPLEARIIFACDAFHAMTTDRPYREALPVEEAFRRLVDAAGTQFDPRVVDVCLSRAEAAAARRGLTDRRRRLSRRAAGREARARGPRSRPVQGASRRSAAAPARPCRARAPSGARSGRAARRT